MSRRDRAVFRRELVRLVHATPVEGPERDEQARRVEAAASRLSTVERILVSEGLWHQGLLDAPDGAPGVSGG